MHHAVQHMAVRNGGAFGHVEFDATAGLLDHAAIHDHVAGPLVGAGDLAVLVDRAVELVLSLARFVAERMILEGGQAVEVETTIEVNFKIIAPPPEEKGGKKRRKLIRR